MKRSKSTTQELANVELIAKSLAAHWDGPKVWHQNGRYWAVLGKTRFSVSELIVEESGIELFQLRLHDHLVCARCEAASINWPRGQSVMTVSQYGQFSLGYQASGYSLNPSNWITYPSNWITYTSNNTNSAQTPIPTSGLQNAFTTRRVQFGTPPAKSQKP